jgi:hypothetical protein
MYDMYDLNCMYYTHLHLQVRVRGNGPYDFTRRCTYACFQLLLILMEPRMTSTVPEVSEKVKTKCMVL